MSFPISIGGKPLDGGANNLPEPAHDGVTFILQDVDSASTGRGADGKMIRDRVAQKIKINLKFPPLTTTQLQSIVHAVNGVDFDVIYLDPRTGSSSTAKFYVGDRIMPVYKTSGNGVDLWINVAFNIIEM